MDEFINNDNNFKLDEESFSSSEQSQPEASETVPEPQESIEENFAEQPAVLSGDSETAGEETYSSPIDNSDTPPIYNPVNYSGVAPIEDYKPMSRGLKVFTVIMALIILLTGTSLAGYYVGRSSVKISYSGTSDVKVDLAAKPKDTDQMTEAQVYEAVNKSVVGIVIYNSSGKGSQASGIVFSEDGYIVTNDHIYSEVAAPKFKIYTYDGKEYDAEYVAGDLVSDLAVLRVKGADLEPAEFGNSDEIYHGEKVVAIGRPNDATDTSSITTGIISAVSRRVQNTSSYSSRLIQTDSAINPGSSGGALVNMYGQVIGVTSSKLASVEYEGVGYAIPTATMKRIVDELISEGKVVSRAKLGVTYTVIDSVTAEISNYEYVGLYLATVAEDSDLYGKAEEGDIITHINGIEVTSDDVVLDIIEQSCAGDKITVTIVKESGTTQTIEAVLKANTSESSYSETEELQGSDGNSNNEGTFDFPFGE